MMRGRDALFEGPRRTGHEVEADRIGAGPDGGEGAGDVGHAADLDQRRPIGRGGILDR